MFSVLLKTVFKNSFEKQEPNRALRKIMKTRLVNLWMFFVFFFVLHDLKMAVFREQLKTVFKNCFLE